MKKLLLLLTIIIFVNDGLANQKRPDYGKIAIEGIIKGIKVPFENLPKTMKIIGKEANKPDDKAKWKKTVKCNEKGLKCKTTYSDY